MVYKIERNNNNNINNIGMFVSPLNFEPSLILREFFLIDHICYYVQVIFIEGGGGWFPLN